MRLSKEDRSPIPPPSSHLNTEQQDGGLVIQDWEETILFLFFCFILPLGVLRVWLCSDFSSSVYEEWLLNLQHGCIQI